MTTWQELRQVSLSEYTDAADGWGKVSSRANAAKDRVDNEMLGKLRETQKGETATAAIGDLERLSRNYQYIHTECGLIRTALNGLAAELEAPKNKLKRALQLAEDNKFTVKADGSVQYPAAVPFASGNATATPGAPIPLLPGSAEGGADRNKALAEQIAEDIAAAVREADEIDGRYARVLRKLKTTDGLDVTDAMFADAAQDTRDLQKAAGDYAKASDIPQGKSAADNAAWWKSLDAERQAEYATLYPASIGALDGLPSAVRDDANRMVLAETRAKYQLELNSFPAEPARYVANPNGSYPAAVESEDWRKWKSRKEELEKGLKGMNAIQKRFDAPPSEGLPPAFLLGFDAKGTGRAIIANGNPDTADNTAVYVPGTTARLEGIGGDINRMTEMWRAANTEAPGETTSTITWLGYDPPQAIVSEATEKQWAYDGSPKLNDFMDGLEAAQGGADASHTTVIGHSYGSTVVGDASNKGDLSADDIIVAGSPGMLVAEADDLDVPKGHVWSAAAGDDFVPTGGKLAGLGGRKWDVHTWNGIPYDAGYIQTVPSDEAFGAHRMDVDTSGHSDYWKRDSLSLRNQALVVVGDYHRVEEDD
ncbi:alpha/beta hydrolase [Streptomyces sp. PR69]|uniref:alpha/beta hydrolase n=1 Tax=Streptomyces sp. PR69 TaxID=2984950 RepID=UPI002264161D|nr:alpha/beta hydrolase [Streptomyces sp. PR69]